MRLGRLKGVVYWRWGGGRKGEMVYGLDWAGFNTIMNE